MLFNWPNPGRRFVAGHTLAELLLVLLLTGVLSTLAVTGFARIHQTIRLRAAKDAMVTTLHIARAQAIYRRGRIVVCKSDGTAACRQSHEWSDGWIVFHDRNHNLQPDAEDAVLHHEMPQPAGVRIWGNRAVAHYVAFLPSGNALQQSGAAQLGTLTVCQKAEPPLDGFEIRLRAGARVRWLAISGLRC